VNIADDRLKDTVMKQIMSNIYIKTVLCILIIIFVFIPGIFAFSQYDGNAVSGGTGRIFIGKIVYLEKDPHHDGIRGKTDFKSDIYKKRAFFGKIWNILPYAYTSSVNQKNEYHALYNDEKDIWEQFAFAFSKEIIKRRSDLSFINFSEFYLDQNSPSEFCGFAIYEDELEEIRYIRRDIAVNTLSHALADTFAQTYYGRKIKEFEHKITRYCKMEYSKSIYEDAATFYLPGQSPPDIPDEEKDFSFSFSSLIHIDSDTLNPEFSFRLIGDFQQTLAKFLYDFSENEASLTFENKMLNKLIGARTGLVFIYEDNAFSTECGISFDF
jgi:hypothetical protein